MKEKMDDEYKEEDFMKKRVLTFILILQVLCVFYLKIL
jgi:hypothetical protein